MPFASANDLTGDTRPIIIGALCHRHRAPFKLFGVPLRACRARDADNLYMAGRNISGDFIAHASYRVTGSSVAIGEGVGKAI